MAVQLNGTPLAAITAAPMVQSAEYALYHPNLSESYKIVNASDAWTAAGGRRPRAPESRSATSIRVSITFSLIGRIQLSAGFSKCDAADGTSHHENQDCNYVSEKVIVAKVSITRTTAGPRRASHQDPERIPPVAGVTGKTAVVNGVEIDDVSGIAPGAWLGNYNVFPVASWTLAANILNAVDAAIEDGADVHQPVIGWQLSW